MSNCKNTRRQARSNRLVRVHWLNRESEAAPAEILDVSDGGIFLVPSGELPGSVGQGDRAWIVLSDGEQPITLTGSVRWRGYSQAHDAIGFGVELDPDCLGLAAHAFAL
jgi:hypothetical protein